MYNVALCTLPTLMKFASIATMCLKAILDSPWMLAVSEEAKLKAIASWITAASSTRKRDKHFTSLLSAIDASELSLSFKIDIARGLSDTALTDESKYDTIL